MTAPKTTPPPKNVVGRNISAAKPVARARRKTNPTAKVEGHIGSHQSAAQQLQKGGYDLTAAVRLEPALDEVKGAHSSWQTEFECATRDGLYRLIERMVDFAYKMEADPDAAYALFLHRGVDMKKKYANPWTRFIVLVCGEFKNNTKCYLMYNTTTLEPRDYRFAYVVRYFMDHKTPVQEVVPILKDRGIAGVIEDDREYYRDPDAEDQAKAEREEKAKDAIPAMVLTAASSTYRIEPGYHELVVRVVGQEIWVYGAKKSAPKEGVDPEEQAERQQNRVISYIANHFADGDTDNVVTDLFKGLGKAKKKVA